MYLYLDNSQLYNPEFDNALTESFIETIKKTIAKLCELFKKILAKILNGIKYIINLVIRIAKGNVFRFHIKFEEYYKLMENILIKSQDFLSKISSLKNVNEIENFLYILHLFSIKYEETIERGEKYLDDHPYTDKNNIKYVNGAIYIRTYRQLEKIYQSISDIHNEIIEKLSRKITEDLLEIIPGEQADKLIRGIQQYIHEMTQAHNRSAGLFKRFVEASLGKPISV